MNSSQKSRWVVDATLFAGFILAFFLDLTGQSLHQWIGLAAAAVAGYHLFAHEAWVDSVTGRFFGKLAARARLYSVLDAALLVGFTTITVTGLVISSWLDLQFASYDTWRFVHIGASIATLLVTVLKLALHWRWIAAATKNIFLGQRMIAHRPGMGPALPGRREFVHLMGVVGISSTIALASSIRSLRAEGSAGSAATEANPPTSTNDDASNGSKAASTNNSPFPAAASSTCSVRCWKRCAYPGRCRRYVDSNNSGR